MKLLRIAAGYSQERLALATDSYQVRISRIERSVGPPPTGDEAERIASVFGVPPEKIFTAGEAK